MSSKNTYEPKITLGGSLQKIHQISQKQYKTAMKHMDKFNQLDKKRKDLKQNQSNKPDPQCTFKPKLFASSYAKKNTLQRKASDKQKQKPVSKEQTESTIISQKRAYLSRRQNRLINWGEKRDQKKLNMAIGNCLKELSSSLQTPKKRGVQPNLNQSLDDISVISTVPGTSSFFVRQAKAKAMKEHKSVVFKDDSYSMLF